MDRIGVPRNELYLIVQTLEVAAIDQEIDILMMSNVKDRAGRRERGRQGKGEELSAVQCD